MKRSEISPSSGVGRPPDDRSAGAAVRAFVHDVVNPLAAIRISVSALRALASLTDGELANLHRIERAAGEILQLVTNLGPAREGAEPPRLAPSDNPSVDLYALCCELAERRRFADLVVIHCRAFGDSRGGWDREQVKTLLSTLFDHAISRLGRRAPITVSVTGMARHVRVDIHGLGGFGAETRESSLDVPARIGPAPAGARVKAVISRTGGTFRLHLPRSAPASWPERAGGGKGSNRP